MPGKRDLAAWLLRFIVICSVLVCMIAVATWVSMRPPADKSFDRSKNKHGLVRLERGYRFLCARDNPDTGDPSLVILDVPSDDPQAEEVLINRAQAEESGHYFTQAQFVGETPYVVYVLVETYGAWPYRRRGTVRLFNRVTKQDESVSLLYDCPEEQGRAYLADLLTVSDNGREFCLRLRKPKTIDWLGNTYEFKTFAVGEGGTLIEKADSHERILRESGRRPIQVGEICLDAGGDALSLYSVDREGVFFSLGRYKTGDIGIHVYNKTDKTDVRISDEPSFYFPGDVVWLEYGRKFIGDGRIFDATGRQYPEVSLFKALAVLDAQSLD